MVVDGTPCLLRNILWVCGKVTAANLYYQMGRVGWAGLGVSQPCCRVYWARAPAPAEGPAVLQPPVLGLA